MGKRAGGGLLPAAKGPRKAAPVDEGAASWSDRMVNAMSTESQFVRT